VCLPQSSGSYAISRLDNDDLDLQIIGSTPIAAGIARGVDVEAFHYGHGTGLSQGLVVDSSAIVTPFDLGGKTIAVPFGSTAHYQMQFIIDIFDADVVRVHTPPHTIHPCRH
jgi:taurine transport system substrate-binding protein